MIPPPLFITEEPAVRLRLIKEEPWPISHPALRIAIEELFASIAPRPPEQPEPITWNQRLQRTDKEEAIYQSEIAELRTSFARKQHQ